jgi:hypothetical protein
MKKLGYLFLLAAIALTLGPNALAQGDRSVYFTTYYANANPFGVVTGQAVPNAPDATIRIINDGDSGATIWASFYVFDDSQELQDCCSCPITPDGVLSESVNNQLANFDLVLTPKLDYRGVIKIIASSTPAGGPSYTNKLVAGLHGFAVHVQSRANQYPYGPGPYQLTETQLQDSNLISSEKTMLESLCSYAQTLGSGFGVCTCTLEDHDF